MMNNTKIAIASISLAFSAIFIITFEVLDAVTVGFWVRQFGDRASYGSQWCEGQNPNLDLFIREPLNGRSDYSYITLGCWMIVLAVFDFKKLLKQDHYSDNGDDCQLAAQEIVLTLEEGKNDPDDQQQQEQQMLQQTGNTNICLSENSDGNGEQVILNAEREDDHGEEEEEQQQTHKVPNALIQYPHITFVHGIFNLLHGLGSFWFHSCQCGPGGTADVMCMLTVASFLIFYTPLQLLIGSKIIISKPSRMRLFSFIPVIGQISFFIATYYSRKLRSNATLVVIISCFALVYPFVIMYLYRWRNKKDFGRHHTLKLYLLFLCFVSFLLGVLCWKLENDRIWCFEKSSKFSWLQGHAVWHLATCASLAFIYFFFRTEKIIEVSTIT
jgi:hypothetical protein